MDKRTLKNLIMMTTLIAICGAIMGALALSQNYSNGSDPDPDPDPTPSEEIEDLVVTNSLTVGTSNNLAKLKTIQGIITDLPFSSSSNISATNINVAGDLSIDGKFTYNSELAADNGLLVTGDLVVNDTDFKIFSNFGSGYMQTTIPIISTSSIVASTVHTTSDLQVDGDLLISGSVDYKSTLTASSGLTVLGDVDFDSGQVTIDDTTFEIKKMLNVTGLSTFQNETRVDEGQPLYLHSFDDTGFIGSNSGLMLIYSAGLPIAQYDSLGHRVSVGTFRAPYGTASTPSYQFWPESGTGFYSPSLNEIGVSCNSTNVMNWTETEINTSVGMRIDEGKSLFLHSTEDTGFIGGGSGLLIAFSNGTPMAQFDSLGTKAITGTFRAPYGTKEIPSFQFWPESGTGLYSPSLHNVSISCDSAEVIQFDKSETIMKSAMRIVDNNSLFFHATDDTGFFGTGSGTLEFFSSGNPLLTLDSTGLEITDSSGSLQIPDGTTLAPSFQFSSGTSTGLYSSALDEVSLTCNNSDIMTWSGTSINSTVPISIPGGTSTSPAMHFENSTTTGFYQNGLDSIGFACDGDSIMTMNSSSITAATSVHLSSDGSASVPAIEFITGGHVTGIYHDGSGGLGLSSSGSNSATFSTSATTLASSQLLNVDGTVSLPAFSFSNAPNTGIYYNATDGLCASSGGSNRFSVSDTAITANVPIVSTKGTHRAISFNTLSSDITISTDEEVYIIDSTSGSNRVITLPIITSALHGKTYVIKMSVNAENTVSIARGGTDEIDMSTNSLTLTANNSYTITAHYGQGWFSYEDIEALDTRVTENESKLATQGGHLISSDATTTLVGDEYSSVILIYDDVDTHQLFLPATGSVPEGFQISIKSLNLDVELLRSASQTSDRIERFDDGTSGYATNWNLPRRVGVMFMRHGGQWKVMSTFDYFREISPSTVYNDIGAEDAPSYTFKGDANTGMYWITNDIMGFTTGGLERGRFSNTKFETSVPMNSFPGTSSLPSYAFKGDPDTGMYWIASNNIGFATAAQHRLSVKNTSIEAVPPFWGANGSALDPTYSFTGNDATGIYAPTTDELAVSTGGTQRLKVTNAEMTANVPIVASKGVYRNITRHELAIDENIPIDDDVYIVHSADANTTITLPAITAALHGKTYTIIIGLNVSFTITVETTGLDIIDEGGNQHVMTASNKVTMTAFYDAGIPSNWYTY